MIRIRLLGLVLTLVVCLLVGPGCAPIIADIAEKNEPDNKNVQNKPDAPKAEEPKKEAPKPEEPEKLGSKAENPKKEEPKPDEPKKDDSKKDDPKPDDPKKDDPKKDDPKKDDPKKDDPKKDDPKKDDPKKDDPKKDDPKKDDPKKDDPKKDDPKKDDPKKDDPKKDDPKKDDPKKDDPKKDDPKKDDPKKEPLPPPKEKPKKDDPKKDDPKKDEPVLPPLVWNFDKPFGQTWVTQVKQVMTISKDKGGAEDKEPITFEYTITTNVTWTPEPKPPTPQEEAKEQLFTLKIDSVKVSLKVPGQELAVDSAGPADVRLPVAALVKLLDQASLKVKLELASMKAEVTGLDEVVQKLSPKDRPAVDLFLSRDALVRQVEAAFPLLPKKDAPTSTAKRKIAAGKLGSYDATTTYSYGEVKKKKVDLKSVSEWTFTPSPEAVGEVKIVKAEPDQVKLEGVTIFDAAKGMVESASVQGKEIKQKLTLLVGKETQTVDIVLDYSFSIAPREL